MNKNKRIYPSRLITLIIVSVAAFAHAENYGLKVGYRAPSIQTKDIDGKDFSSRSAIKTGPLVLVFYRGGWFPFCNAQLHSLQVNVMPVVNEQHATLAAISVNIPDEELKTRAKHSLTMTIISNPATKILGSYKVQYKVPAALVAKYKNDYHLDLEKSNDTKVS